MFIKISTLHDNSDFMNNIETNDLILVWRLILLEMKIIIDKDYFGTTVTKFVISLVRCKDLFFHLLKIRAIIGNKGIKYK